MIRPVPLAAALLLVILLAPIAPPAARAAQDGAAGLPPGVSPVPLTAAAIPYPADTIEGAWLVIRTPGAVYDGWRFDHLVEVRAPGVVIRNSLFRGTDRAVPAASLLRVAPAQTGAAGAPASVVVERSTFAPRFPNNQLDGVRGSNFLLSGVEITGTVDGVHIHGGPAWSDPAAGNVRVTGSWIHDLTYFPVSPGHNDGSHNDGIQIVGGRGIAIEGNWIDGRLRNAAIMVGQSYNPISDLRIAGNVLGGGACTINVFDRPGTGAVERLAITGNTFLAGTQIRGCAMTITPATRAVVVRAGNMWDSGAQVDQPCRPASNCIASVASAGAGAVLGPLGDSMYSAWWSMQAKVMTFWTSAPTPTAADLVGPGSARGYVAWLSQLVLVASILAAAARTILSHDARNLADAARALALTILVSAVGITVAAALVKAGDAIASALLADSLAQSAAEGQSAVEGLIANGGGPGLSMLLGILGVLASLVQFFVLLSRNAILPVVVLLLPLAAAGGGTALGKAWFSKLTAWILALAFYKPVAAAIYAVVLTQARGADTTMKALIALTGMFMAVLAMPALIKLFSPNPAGGGGGGGGYAVGMAAGTAVRAASTRGGTS